MERPIGNDLRFTGDLDELGEALKNGTLQGASDGSVKNKIGTSACIIEPTHLTRDLSNIGGAGPVDRDPDTMNSTRAERSGFLGPLHTVTLLAKRYNAKHGGITMHVDNTSSFQQGDQSKLREGALRYQCGDYNLKQMKKEITDKLDKRNITITFKHVKAHQDEKRNRKKDKQGNIIPLTQPDLLNIDYDARAEDQYAEDNKSTSRIMPHSSINTYFESGDVINTGKLLQQIVKDRHGLDIQKYIKRNTNSRTNNSTASIGSQHKQLSNKKYSINHRGYLGRSTIGCRRWRDSTRSHQQHIPHHFVIPEGKHQRPTTISLHAVTTKQGNSK